MCSFGRLLKLSFSVRFEVQSIINFGLHNGDWGELYCWYVQNGGGDAGNAAAVHNSALKSIN